jgi:hypothetical protein
VFWKVEIKQEQQGKKKESETWIYKVPTEYDVQMSELSAYLPQA